jgi:serine/threonine-protein kinase RsbW
VKVSEDFREVDNVSQRAEAVDGDADESRTVRLTIPAKPEYITLSRLALTGLSRVRPLADDTLADLKLALTEACSNSVRHAYGEAGGHVEISFELRPDRLVVEVADDGSGFDAADVGRDVDSEEDLTEGGLGIAIIRSIADEVDIADRSDGRGSRLRFVKLLQ